VSSAKGAAEVIFQYKQRIEMSELRESKEAEARERRGFFGRLVAKLDATMKQKAEAKAEQGCCCCNADAGDDEGDKGKKCC
jgi:hypothetical protein